MTVAAALLLAVLLASCTGVPEGIEPVRDFRLQPYLGRWYEIARLDHSFERGLSQVTAEYSLRDDGGVRVLNRGYAEAEREWNDVEGKAYFVEGPETGYLKVSFFGPFYGSYIIVDLDRENYRWSLVSGPDRSYLWILARSSSIDPELKARLVARAAELGFDTSALVFVDQSKGGPP